MQPSHGPSPWLLTLLTFVVCACVSALVSAFLSVRAWLTARKAEPKSREEFKAKQSAKTWLIRFACLLPVCAVCIYLLMRASSLWGWDG